MARAQAMTVLRRASEMMQHQAGAVVTAHEQAAAVFSMAERLARRQQARDDMLYESILARTPSVLAVFLPEKSKG